MRENNKEKGVNKYDTIVHVHTLGITIKEKIPVDSDNLIKEPDHRKVLTRNYVHN